MRPKRPGDGRRCVTRLGPETRLERFGKTLLAGGGIQPLGVSFPSEGDEQEEFARFVEESRAGVAGKLGQNTYPRIAKIADFTERLRSKGESLTSFVDIFGSRVEEVSGLARARLESTQGRLRLMHGEPLVASRQGRDQEPHQYRAGRQHRRQQRESRVPSYQLEGALEEGRFGSVPQRAVCQVSAQVFGQLVCRLVSALGVRLHAAPNHRFHRGGYRGVPRA